MNITCHISLGELIDKISILRIKLSNIQDEIKLKHVKKEEQTLTETLMTLGLSDIDLEVSKMIEVNLELWKIEDEIRECEREKKFDQRFIELARAVYVTNDERFKRKNAINEKYNSTYTEVKSYKKY
jgi:hypothetical protein